MYREKSETRREKVCQALSMTEWKDCFDIANQTGLTLAGCGKLLGELYREGSLRRRASSRNNNADYEYLLRPGIDNAN